MFLQVGIWMLLESFYRFNILLINLELPGRMPNIDTNTDYLL